MTVEQTLDDLRRFDTPTICNVIELFDVRPHTSGHMDSRVKASFPELPPMVGFASTATFRCSEAPNDGSTFTTEDQLARFGELPGAPVIVFQDLDDPPAGATFGDIMCSTYQAFGAVGLITSGAGRDLVQIRALGFPVFTTGTVCSHGYHNFPDIHVPVRVGGLVVRPGDLLHGDGNGVVSIPLQIATEVAAIAPEFAAAESIVLDVVRKGRPAARLLADARAEQRSMIAGLRSRVSHKGR